MRRIRITSVLLPCVLAAVIFMVLAGCTPTSNAATPSIALHASNEPVSAKALSSNAENITVDISDVTISDVDGQNDNNIARLTKSMGLPTAKDIPVITEEGNDDIAHIDEQGMLTGGYLYAVVSETITNNNSVSATYDVSQSKFYIVSDGTVHQPVGGIDPVTCNPHGDSSSNAYWLIEVPPHSSITETIICVLPTDTAHNEKLAYCVTRGQGGTQGLNGLNGYWAHDLWE